MKLRALISFWIAGIRRRQGIYNQTTVNYYKYAAQLSSIPRFLIGYAMFQRETVGTIDKKTLSDLISIEKQHIPTPLKRKLDMLLAEFSTNNLVAKEPELQAIFDNQADWREELVSYLQNSSISVVGNSASLANSGLGKSIDESDIVCRFNRFPTTPELEDSIGSKTDIWIISPDVLNESRKPPKSIKWIIVSGADARFKLQKWGTYKEYIKVGARIITIPLNHWTDLVKELEAPPTAGLLWLNFLISKKPENSTINVFGFGNTLRGSRYHLRSKSDAPSWRHNWVTEKKIINQLQQQQDIHVSKNKIIVSFSRGLTNNRTIEKLLKTSKIHHNSSTATPNEIDLVVGWGRKPNTKNAMEFANKHSIPYTSLEDGFIHSMSQGRLGADSYSLVVDNTGIFYDATRSSDLESIINTLELNSNQSHRSKSCISTLINNNITKYNNTSTTSDNYIKRYKNPILVVDQVNGDMSIAYSHASRHSFSDMLEAAIAEHPDSDILIKTHPDVITCKKKGGLELPEHLPDNVHLIRENINSVQLIKYCKMVYVVSSQLGFEALMVGKPVVCFGVPFYAGWGLTDDRAQKSLPVFGRRKSTPTVEIIFYASYIIYSTYLHPESARECELEEILSYIQLQIRQYKKNSGRYYCIGLTPWKRRFIKDFLRSNDNEIHFINSRKKIHERQYKNSDKVLIWSSVCLDEVSKLKQQYDCEIIKVEDGFIRSINLGSNYAPPSSLVFDSHGIYFDPREPSGLEKILQSCTFDQETLQRAQALRQQIISLRISKYNLEKRHTNEVIKSTPDDLVILIPGQVSDDASMLLGGGSIKSNLDLMKQVRAKNPLAYIVYKPHPDVLAQNREGSIVETQSLQYCDQIISEMSIADCLDQTDEVHTMTSLVGFEALLRKIKVVCYGKPFYAGWGLTDDMHKLPRRTKKLTINELSAGCLIEYPIYFNWKLHAFSTPEELIKIFHTDRHKSLSSKNSNPLFKFRKISLAINLFKAIYFPSLR